MAGPRPIDLEALVLAGWREIFDVDVRPDDDFFALGGNSLSALHLLEHLSGAIKIPEEMGAVILIGLFENATPHAFAAFLDGLALQFG